MWSTVLTLGIIVAEVVAAISVISLWRARGAEAIEGARWGDCTDEMFEAMREVDAMGLSGEPLLVCRLPPRDAYPVRFDRPGTFVEVDCRPEQVANWVRIVEPDGAEFGGFEIEFDPISGKTRHCEPQGKDQEYGSVLCQRTIQPIYAPGGNPGLGARTKEADQKAEAMKRVDLTKGVFGVLLGGLYVPHSKTRRTQTSPGDVVVSRSDRSTLRGRIFLVKMGN